MNRAQSIVSAIVVLIVNIGSVLGVGIDGNVANLIASVIVVVAATAWAAWRDHNFTSAALEGQKVIDQLKAENKENA